MPPRSADGVRGPPRRENAIQTAMWKTLIAVAALLGALYVGNIMWMFKADADAHTPLGNVAALRFAVGHYVRKHGKPPERFSQLVPDFINVVPRVKLPGRGATDAVELYGREACAAMDAGMKPALNKETLRNTGRWGYIVDPGGPCHGAVFIDSTDPQERVQPYYTY